MRQAPTAPLLSAAIAAFRSRIVRSAVFADAVNAALLHQDALGASFENG
jgi:hypothetical protein